MTLKEFMDEHEGAFFYIGTTKAAGWLLIGNITVQEVDEIAHKVAERRVQTTKYYANTIKHKIENVKRNRKIKDKEKAKAAHIKHLDRGGELIEYWQARLLERFSDREIVDSYERSGADGYPGIAVIVEGAESSGYWDYIEQEKKFNAGGTYCASRYC